MSKVEKMKIFLDKKSCLKCTRLVGELGTKTFSCSYKKGNLKCPAHQFSLEVGVDTESALENFYLALQGGNLTDILVALEEAKTNPKISSAIIEDLQSRLFDVVEPELTDEQTGAGAQPETGNVALESGEGESSKAAEDDSEEDDEDVEA